MARKSRSRNRQVNKKASKRRGLRGNSNKTKLRKNKCGGSNLDNEDPILYDDTTRNNKLNKKYLDSLFFLPIPPPKNKVEYVKKYLNKTYLEKVLENINTIVKVKNLRVIDPEKESVISLLQRIEEILGSIDTVIEKDEKKKNELKQLLNNISINTNLIMVKAGH